MIRSSRTTQLFFNIARLCRVAARIASYLFVYAFNMRITYCLFAGRILAVSQSETIFYAPRRAGRSGGTQTHGLVIQASMPQGFDTQITRSINWTTPRLVCKRTGAVTRHQEGVLLTRCVIAVAYTIITGFRLHIYFSVLYAIWKIKTALFEKYFKKK